MATDFLDSHHRHWHDAELLFREERWANADQLYGLAAECGLKRLMIEFGMPHDSSGPSERKDKVHVNRLWRRFEDYRSGHSVGPAFSLPQGEPFEDWSIEQRYAATDEISEGQVQAHRTACEMTRALVKMATMQGLL